MICKSCGKEFFEDWRKDSKIRKTPCRFCCIECSHSRSLSKETKEKISKSLLKYHSPNPKRNRYFYDKDTELGRFERSQAYSKKSPNLIKVGFNFEGSLEKEYQRIKTQLFNDYIIEEKSTLEINLKYSFKSSRTGYDILKLFNIERRDLSESLRLALKNNKVQIPGASDYHQGWYIDWRGNSHFLRSQLEFDLAEKLDSNKEEYLTEVPITYFSIKENKVKIGLPDFYLPNKKLFIETKGEYFLDREDLLDRSKVINEMGCDFKVLVGNHKNEIIEEINWAVGRKVDAPVS